MRQVTRSNVTEGNGRHSASATTKSIFPRGCSRGRVRAARRSSGGGLERTLAYQELRVVGVGVVAAYAVPTGYPRELGAGFSFRRQFLQDLLHGLFSAGARTITMGWR